MTFTTAWDYQCLTSCCHRLISHDIAYSLMSCPYCRQVHSYHRHLHTQVISTRYVLNVRLIKAFPFINISFHKEIRT